MSSKYDLEYIIDQVEKVLRDNINTKLNQIEQEKLDGLSLKKIDSNAYFKQELDSRTVNYNPFVLTFIKDIQGEGLGPHTSQIMTLTVLICLADQNPEDSIYRQVMRYHRALQEVFQEHFTEIESGSRIVVTTLKPDYLQLLNSSRMHRVVGVDITMGIA